MPGVSIHVVDVSRGVLAVGMQVQLYVIGDGGKFELVTKGHIGANGLLDKPELAKTFATGGYVAFFHVADFYRAEGVAMPGSASPTRRSTITCRSNARRGAIPASAAVHNSGRSTLSTPSWPGLARPSTSCLKERRGCPAQGRA